MANRFLLVVENDAGYRTLLCEKLEDRGITSLQAADAEEALSVLRRHCARVGAAVLDIDLTPATPRGAGKQGRDRFAGFRLARTIRQEFPRIRLLGMSYSTSEEVQEWFGQYGQGYLRKSWLTEGASDEFLGRVEKVMRSRARRRVPVSFVVHGHDHRALAQVVRFVERTPPVFHCASGSANRMIVSGSASAMVSASGHRTTRSSNTSSMFRRPSKTAKT